MEATDAYAAATTTHRLNPFQHLCANRTSYWSCSIGPFRGCCSHDPCHDGLCHDLPEALSYLSAKSALNRRDEIAVASTSDDAATTQTYTLVHILEQTKALALNALPAIATLNVPVVSSAPKPLVQSQAVKPTTATTAVISPSASTTINPTAAPVPGSKKSSRTVTGISLGVIAATIVVLLLLYLCITRKRRSALAKAASLRAKRLSQRWSTVGSIGAGGNTGSSKEGSQSQLRDRKNRKSTKQQPQLTPITPGGASLEAQKWGAVTSDDNEEEDDNEMKKGEDQTRQNLVGTRFTGFRIPGMTAANRDTDTDVHAPTLKQPTPVKVAEHPARFLGFGMGVLGVGLVHPAYRNGGGGGGSGAAKESNKQQERQQQQQQEQQDVKIEAFQEATMDAEYNEKRASWTPGGDVLNVLKWHGQSSSTPLEEVSASKTPLLLGDSSSSMPLSSSQEFRRSPIKPKFEEVISKWAAVSTTSREGIHRDVVMVASDAVSRHDEKNDRNSHPETWQIGRALTTPEGPNDGDREAFLPQPQSCITSASVPVPTNTATSASVADTAITKENNNKTMAMCTDNEITSPVEVEGNENLQRLIRRKCVPKR